MLSLTFLLILLGLGSGFNYAYHPRHLNLVEQNQGVDEHEPTVYEQTMDRFKSSVVGYKFTDEEGQKLFGEMDMYMYGAGIPQSVLATIGYSLFIRANEIRRVFGLKQQPLVCGRLVKEKLIDPRTKVNPKAMRYLQLSLSMWEICGQLSMSGSLDSRKMIDDITTKAQWFTEKFPEIQEVFERKYEEAGIEQFTLDKSTINKTLIATYEVITVVNNLLTDVQSKRIERVGKERQEENQGIMKFYQELIMEHSQLSQEDF